MNGPASLARQTVQTTPIVDRVVHQVTITDPTHPLSGRTLALVEPTPSCSIPNKLTLQLPSGEHRVVDCGATDMAPQVSPLPTSGVSPLPVSVHTLLPLAHHVRRLLNVIEERGISKKSADDYCGLPCFASIPRGVCRAS